MRFGASFEEPESNAIENEFWMYIDRTDYELFFDGIIQDSGSGKEL